MKKVSLFSILIIVLFSSCAGMIVSSKQPTFSRLTEPPEETEIPEGTGVAYFYRITADQGAWARTWVSLGSYGKFELEMNGYRAFLLPEGTYQARVSHSTGRKTGTADFSVGSRQVIFMEIKPDPAGARFLALQVSDRRALELMADDHLSDNAVPISSQIAGYVQRTSDKPAPSVSKSVPAEKQDRKELPIVTVFDFSFEGVSEKESQVLVDFLSGALFDTNEYRIIDRNQREAILSEIEFSLSGCIDESCQLEAGRLLAADFMVVGSLGKLGTRYVINAKLVEIETGETILSARNVYDNVDRMLDGTSGIAENLLFD